MQVKEYQQSLECSRRKASAAKLNDWAETEEEVENNEWSSIPEAKSKQGRL